MSTLFKVKDGGLYDLREVSPEEAEHFGVPAATHLLALPVTGARIYGTITASGRVKGAEVRVPGVAGRAYGVRSVFRDAQPEGAEDRTVLDGYLVQGFRG
mgnify:CR=1 FL=1